VTNLTVWPWCRQRSSAQCATARSKSSPPSSESPSVDNTSRMPCSTAAGASLLQGVLQRRHAARSLAQCPQHTASSPHVNHVPLCLSTLWRWQLTSKLSRMLTSRVPPPRSTTKMVSASCGRPRPYAMAAATGSAAWQDTPLHTCPASKLPTWLCAVWQPCKTPTLQQVDCLQAGQPRRSVGGLPASRAEVRWHCHYLRGPHYVRTP
jgi:hypothetical protein